MRLRLVQRSGLGHSRRHRQQRRLGCLADPLHDRRHDADRDDRQRLPEPVHRLDVRTTVKYRAFDIAGNAETTNSQLLQIDTVAPSSMIQCNATTCAASFYSAAVSVTLTASDVGGSGVSQIVYTTDGSDPSQSNGTVYCGRVHALRHDDCQVPRLRHRRQRRADQLGADSGGH